MLFFVLLSSCPAQTKQILNENELSILLFNDTIAYYNGILDKNIKVTKIAFDTTTIKELVKKNKKKYADRLRVFIKLSDASWSIENVMKLAEIVQGQEVFVTAFPLTKTDKSYFKVEEFSWEPAETVEIATPSSITVKDLPESPALIVEFRKDSTVWCQIMTNDDDTAMKKINPPIGENLKKIVADYKEMMTKENIIPTYFLKGNSTIKYPAFKEVLSAFKENDVYKFKMITAAEIYQTAPEEEVKSNLFMLKDQSNEIKTKSTDSILTLLLLKNNILAYKGNRMPEAKTYDYKNIRQALTDDAKKFGGNLFVIIKPSAESSYKNTVDILDEMTICNIKRYAMVDLVPVEVELIKKFNSTTERRRVRPLPFGEPKVNGDPILEQGRKR